MRRMHSFLRIVIGSVAVFCLLVLGNGLSRGQSGAVTAAAAADPSSYVFQLELGGVVVAEYTECSGLGSINDILEDTVAAAKSEGVGTVIQKSTGALRWPEIKLRRKGLSDPTVWSWRQDLEKGDITKALRDGAITVVTAVPANMFVGRWVFHGGLATRLTFGDAGEELVIVHQGLESAPPTTGGTARASRS